MIIELTGIPGSGKSTILSLMKEVLSEEKYIFDIKKYILGFQGNTFVFDIYLLISFYKITIEDWVLLKKIFKLVYFSKNSLFHKINILRNSYKKIIINAFVKKSDKVFFIDEGLSHIPFTLFVDDSVNFNSKQMIELIQNLSKVDLLLIIDAPDNLLMERVVNRGKKGHRRINFDSHEDIVKFMNQSREVLEIIKTTIKHKTYNNIQTNIDIKEILKMVGINNV